LARRDVGVDPAVTLRNDKKKPGRSQSARRQRFLGDLCALRGFSSNTQLFGQVVEIDRRET